MSIIFKRDTISYLNRQLYLPYSEHVQDWDVEMADHERIQEFVDFFNTQTTLTSDQQTAIVALILASYDDLLNVTGHNEKIWADIALILKENISDLHDLLNYWTSDKDDKFRITALLKSL